MEEHFTTCALALFHTEPPIYIMKINQTAVNYLVPEKTDTKRWKQPIPLRHQPLKRSKTHASFQNVYFSAVVGKGPSDMTFQTIAF